MNENNPHIKPHHLVIAKMWNDKMTSNMIAKELDMTRSAVMGVVNRMIRWGVCHKRGNPQYVRAKKPKFQDEVTKTKAENKISLAPVTTFTSYEHLPIESLFFNEHLPIESLFSKPTPNNGEEKTILELNPTDCRWMNSKTRYCGKPGKSSVRPWCPKHYKMVYSSSKATRNELIKMKRLFRSNMRMLKTS